MAYTLDTAVATERITAAGIPAAATRAIVAEVARADEGIATSADLAAVRSDLDATAARLETAMLRLERRLILSGLAGLGLLFAALRLTG